MITNKLLIKLLLIAAMTSGVVNLAGCGGSDKDDSADTVSDDTTATDDGSDTSDESADDGSDESSGEEATSSAIDTSNVNIDSCSESTDIDNVVCAANAFLATLSTEQQASVLYDWSDSTAKTTWSNLPGVTRNGLMFGNLDAEQVTAALGVAKAALSDAGYEDFIGLLKADDYLGSYEGTGTNTGGAGDGTFEPPTDGAGTPPDGGTFPTEGGTPPAGGGMGGGAYSSANYYIAFIGQPTVDNYWMLQIGGHHLAYNITYLAGDAYSTPHHMGAEPKVSFELESVTYASLADEGDAMVAMFAALSSSELEAAYLSGQSFADVLMGPDNGNGTGVAAEDYPDPREGVLVSSLSADQQALVKTAIAAWVSDYASDSANARLAEYTSDAILAETYIAWGGTESAGVDVDVNGTYMRIDGPRLWIEVVCQNGVIIQNQTHYHTIFRDKTMDYGNSL